MKYNKQFGKCAFLRHNKKCRNYWGWSLKTEKDN